jgi:hypothetical protein
MSFPRKTIKCSCGGHEISVTAEKLGESPNHSYKFTAVLEDSTYEHTLTIGAVDGPVEELSIEDFQASVDAAREIAANHVHLRHAVKQLESQIV